MSEAQTTEVVLRTPNQVNRHELERRSRPDSSHKGNLKRLKTSSVSGFQRWEKENELLWAMLEDETEWLAKLFPDIIITPELFFYALEDGVVLCRLANLIQESADKYGKKNKIKVSGKRFKFHTSIQKKNKHLALFKSRENVQGFLTWCRQLGISDSILFESNDIVEADECREGCREVVICLMEIARRASGRFKFTPIPKLIQLEKEIEAEERQEAEENHFDQVDYVSSDGDSTDSGHGQSLDHSSPPLNNHETNHSTPGGTKKKPKKQHPKSELDKEVFKIIDNFNVYNIRKIKEGKYNILGKIMFVRMLNGHVLLRIGGGWDTLEHYLLTHLPKAAAAENTQSQSESSVSPSVSKTPQKSQLTKILDKVKKEQQLKKATPVSSPHRAAAAKQQEESSGDDEKDITSAIRKIEFSVNQNIATRRKHSKVSVEERSAQKSPPPATELKLNPTSDINQNSIEQKLCEDQLKQYPQSGKAPCFNNCTKKMDDEASRTENEFSEQGINGDSEFNSGVVDQNGEGTLLTFEGSSGNEGFDFNEVEKSEADGHSVGGATDMVDAGFGAHLHANEITARDSPDIKVSEYAPSESVGGDAVALESCNGGSPESEEKPTTQEGENVSEKTSQNSCDANLKEQPDSPAPEQLSGVESPTETSDSPPISADDASNSNRVEPTAAAPDVSAPASNGNASPGSDKRAVSPQEKKGSESPKKKKLVKNTKEPLKSKQTTGRVTAAKKEAPGSNGARPKSAHTKPAARGTTTESEAARNGSKRPTTTTRSTTTSSTKPNPTPSTTTKKLKSSSTQPSATKKPASKPEAKNVASVRSARPTKTSAFGSTVSSKPAATKKPGDSARPATAPPARSTQVKGKPVAAKVQTGLSSARPHSARPAAKPASTVGKDATDGGAASKGTGKPLKTTSPARPTSPTKPLVRKTQTRTVTTLKTTKLGATGEPEVKSQTLKTTRTVTEANGKRTTKTTVKEVAPPGRKPLRMTKTETTEARGAPGKKTGSVESKPGTRATRPDTKKPETKAGGRVGSTGPSKTTRGPGTKKTTNKTGVKGEQKVSSHLKGTIPKAKTVKELSNALGITKPGSPSPEPTVKTPEPEAKPAEEPTTPQDESKPVEGDRVSSPEVIPEDFGNVIEKEDDNIVERMGEVVVEKMEEKAVETVEEGVVEKADEEKEEEASEINEKEDEENNENPAQTEVHVLVEKEKGTDEMFVEESKEIVVEDENNVKIDDEIHGEEETEHALIETEHALIETELGPVETEHELVETKHEVVETEYEVVETEHEMVEAEPEIEEPEHEMVDTEHEVVETEQEIAPEYLSDDWKFTTSATTTISQTVTMEDREEVNVEDKEVSSSPELLENVPTKDDFEEEPLEDSLDVIHVPADDTSTEETKFEKIEAWPAVDDYSQHAPRGEIGDGDSEGEPEKELEGIGESDVSSPDIPEQYFDEESKPDVLAEEKPQVDPWDPDANRVSPCVSPPATFETEKESDYPPDIASHEDNNNIADALLEPEPQFDPDLHSAPAISHGEPFPGTGEESGGEAGDEQLLLEDFNECGKPAPHIDFLEFTGFHGNDGASKEENGGEATVDDLLG